MRKSVLMLAASGLVSFGLLAVVGIASASTTGTLLPVSDGAYTQWTPSSGSAHSVLVDESSCNGNTDYVSTTTTGNRDSYGVDVSSIPDGSVITAIEITPCASKKNNGGTNSTMNVFYRYNGVDSSDSGSYSLSGTVPANLSATTFSSLNLAKASSTTLQIGAVHTAGSKGLKLSRIAVVVTYDSAPLAPSNLTATLATSSTSSAYSLLHWTDNSNNESGFELESSTDGVNFSLIQTLSTNFTATSDGPLSSGVTYYYRVRAYNSVGNSNYSNIASVFNP